LHWFKFVVIPSIPQNKFSKGPCYQKRFNDSKRRDPVKSANYFHRAIPDPDFRKRSRTGAINRAAAFGSYNLRRSTRRRDMEHNSGFANDYVLACIWEQAL